MDTLFNLLNIDGPPDAAQTFYRAKPLFQVTPSKIPVGSFRVEEEKAINRALNGFQQEICLPCPSCNFKNTNALEQTWR